MADAKGQVNFLIILLLFFLPAGSTGVLLYHTFFGGLEWAQWAGLGGAIVSGLLLFISFENLSKHSSSIVRIIIGINSIILGLAIMVVAGLIIYGMITGKTSGKIIGPIILSFFIASFGFIFVGIGAGIMIKSEEH